MFMRIISFIISAIICFLSLFGVDAVRWYRVKAPVGMGQYTENESAVVNNADFYVSQDGSDSNNGSFDSPFATIQKARDEVKKLDKSARNGITVAIKAGDYRVDSLEFTREDSGTAACPVTYCAYGDGEVVLNGGLSLSGKDFKKVTDEKMLSRLNLKAQKKVLCVDLKSFGITAEQYGKIYAIGTYHTAMQYDGDFTGSLYCELFVNDKRQTIARYPNSGYLHTDKVVKTGLGKESSSTSPKVENWDSIRNPESDIYKVSSSLAKRINSWQTLDDVWMFGFWKYDWADASTLIGSFDYEKKELSPKFVSMFGTKEGAPYYFFNVFEELDSEGEWYLDRENGVIYLYPDKNFDTATIDLTLTTKPVIYANADYLTFKNLTVKGTRGDGVKCIGNGNRVKCCTIKNIADYGVVMYGYDNLVSENEITHTGRGGVLISGGDINTLKEGNSKADNNLIHDWSEIYQTYQPAVTLDGVGNTCSHNEIYNSPHEAITYRGNNHIIEYNVIHDVCLLSDDAGAIYSGRRWDWYGNIIRYNCIYNIGSDGHKPDGIYMDDTLSGQTIYGNLLINVPKIGIHLGGGRDLDVRNNIIINSNDRPISYDQRGFDGLSGGWFTYTLPNSYIWQKLYESPWKSEVWQNAFPQMAKISDDFDDMDNPDFGANPAYSTVSGNLIINTGASIGYVAKRADQFSDISGNALFKLTNLNKLFNSPETGDFTLKEDSVVYNQLPDFENLPIAEMGRY